MSKKRIATDGGRDLTSNAFSGLQSLGLPSAAAPASPTAPVKPEAPVKKGRVHLRIEKSGRSGKTVTVLFGEGVESVAEAAREDLLKRLKGSLGCGGAVADGLVELQGDVRERVAVILRELGYAVK